MDRVDSVFISVRASPRKGSTRRSVLLGTAASIVSVGLWTTPAQTQRVADDFLKLSRALTGHTNLDPVTATRIFNAMSKLNPGFAEQAGTLARLVRDGDAPKTLLSAAESAGLRDPALAVVSAWYTGTVGKGASAVVVSYVDALMYRPTSDGLTVPTYCSNGPLWWTRPIPLAGVAVPAPASKNG